MSRADAPRPYARRRTNRLVLADDTGTPLLERRPTRTRKVFSLADELKILRVRLGSVPVHYFPSDFGSATDFSTAPTHASSAVSDTALSAVPASEFLRVRQQRNYYIFFIIYRLLFRNYFALMGADERRERFPPPQEKRTPRKIRKQQKL